VAASGSLQPSSVLAAASALAAAAAAGFTGAPASSSVIAAGKTGNGGKPASSSLAAGPVSAAGGSSTPGVLCSGEPGTQSLAGIAAAAAAGAPWVQLEQRFQGNNSTGLHTTHALQQHRSSGGGNDTSQSGIDCTPRSLPTAGSSRSISTAAPMVVSGGLALHAASTLGAQPSATTVDGSGSSAGTPRAMETDTPGGLPAAAKAVSGSTLKLSTGISITAASNATMQQQPQPPVQQQHAPVALAAHQRHSSGGLDVLTTGGMRGQADQATLVATGTGVKLQPGSSPAAATAAGGYAPAARLEGKGLVANAVAAFLAQQQQQQHQQQQQQHYAGDAGVWASPQAPVEQQHVQDMNCSSGNGSFSQQQQALLLQQQLLMQQQLDMTIVGQGVSNGGNKPHQQLGPVLIDRLLPRMQH